MRHRVTAVAVVALGLFATTACSGQTTPGTPSPAPSSSAPTKQVPPYGGAPKVAAPLPDSVLTGSPCDALTADQVKNNLGAVVSGKPDQLAGIGPKCTWANLDTGGQVGVYFSIEDHQGLSGVYANTRPQMKTWKEIPPIQGLPAVAYSDKSGPNPSFCQVTVGITDTLSIDVGTYLSDSKTGKVDACTVAPLTANDVVTTLKARS